MSEDGFDAAAGLYEQGESLLRAARSAARAPAGPGTDSTGSITVTMDDGGRVSSVVAAVHWRQRIGPEKLADAVIEAVRDAAQQRLAAWGEAFTETHDASPIETAAGNVTVGSPLPDRLEFQRRLHEVSTADMSAEDRRVALAELLALAQSIERGIDEVSGRLQTTLAATYTGHSPDRHVAVTVSGGGDITSIRYDRNWLRTAHEINVGRQTTAAVRDAYRKGAAGGVERLIADSSLGAVQRATQDPLGLARRLRLAD